MLISQRRSSGWESLRSSHVSLELTLENYLNPFRNCCKHLHGVRTPQPTQIPTSWSHVFPQAFLQLSQTKLFTTPACFHGDQEQHKLGWVYFQNFTEFLIYPQTDLFLDLAPWCPFSRPGLILNWYLTGYACGRAGYTPRKKLWSWKRLFPPSWMGGKPFQEPAKEGGAVAWLTRNRMILKRLSSLPHTSSAIVSPVPTTVTGYSSEPTIN